MNALVTEWWPAFFQSYVGGDIYGVDNDVFTNSQNLSGSWTIDDENDTQMIFSHDFPDLSANLYEIKLEYDSIDQSASLTLEVTGEVSTPVSVMAFGVGDGHPEYWGHYTAQGSAILEIPDLKDLYDEGWRRILVVAVNCNRHRWPAGKAVVCMLRQ